MGAKSRAKGKSGELEVMRRLREIFPSAKRGIQSRGGGKEAEDVVIPAFHVEVKRHAVPNIYAAIRQAVTDAKPGKWPVAYTRRDRGEWLVTMRAEDWEEMVRQWAVETRTGRE